MLTVLTAAGAALAAVRKAGDAASERFLAQAETRSRIHRLRGAARLPLSETRPSGGDRRHGAQRVAALAAAPDSGTSSRVLA